MRPSFPAVVDSTMLNAFRSCPRRAQLCYIDHWKSAAPNVHLHAGGAFARGLEVARKAYFDANADEETAAAAGLHALISAYGDFDCPPDSAKSLERMCGAFVYYFDVWPLASDSARPLKLPSGAHAIEFSFAQPILDVPHPNTGAPIIYSGRTDMIVEMESGIFIEDDKTTSSLGRSWSQQWELRGQFTGYCWAAEQASIRVDGVLIRGVSILKTRYEHAQHITFRPQWEIERWYKQTVRDLRRWIDLWHSGAYDYNLGEACTEYGGCMFTEICKKQNPEEWLPAYFVRRKWDPLKRTEEEVL